MHTPLALSNSEGWGCYRSHAQEVPGSQDVVLDDGVDL